MRTMKNKVYKKIVFLLTVSICFVSCDQDKFLNTPAPNLSDKEYFVDGEAAKKAIAGVYDPLGWYNYFQLTEWAIGDTASDDAEKGGGGDGDYAEIFAISKFNANAENSLIGQRWKDFYIGINRANKVIEGLTDNENIEENARDRYIAEARFLRGFYMFGLVNTFGGVPIVDHILSPSEYTNPRNTIEECWAFIEEDFKAAAAKLPKKSVVKAEGNLGRATWGAATSMLAKTYIFQQKWTEAEAAAKEVVDSGEYSLQPNYGDLFTIATDNGVESVFDVQFADLKSPAWLDAHEGSHLEVFHRSRDTRNGGWGFNQPTQSLYDEFEDGDIRRGWTIISDGDVLWQGTADEEVIYTARNAETHPDSYTNYHRRKGTLPKSLRGNGEDQAGLNIRVIRFADVLLWQAEAAAHNGSDWETPLNKVRSRVGLGATPIADPVQAVLHERRVELGMEGHRYWDLMRTNRGNLIPGFTDNKKYLLIPQEQINLNPNLEQNPY